MSLLHDGDTPVCHWFKCRCSDSSVDLRYVVEPIYMMMSCCSDLFEDEDERPPHPQKKTNLRKKRYLRRCMRSSMEQGTTAMEKLVEKLENVEEKAECKKLKKELEEARLSNTFLRICDLKERTNELLMFDELRRVPLVEREGSPPECCNCFCGHDDHASKRLKLAHAIREYTFAGFMKCNPAAFHGVEGAVELQRWFEKTKCVFEISECAEGKKVKYAVATLEGPALTWWKTKVATMEEILRTGARVVNLKGKEYDINNKARMREPGYRPSDGKLPLGICKEKSVALRKVKQEILEKFVVVAYAIKDASRKVDGLLHDTVIVCGEKVVRIPYGNKMLIVEGDKGGSRLKIILYIKARKYVKQGCHLFLAHVHTKQVEFRIDSSTMGALLLCARIDCHLALKRKHFDYAFRTRIWTFELQVMPFRLIMRWCFWIDDRGHVIDRSGVHVDPSKIEAIKSWVAPTTPTMHGVPVLIISDKMRLLNQILEIASEGWGQFGYEYRLRPQRNGQSDKGQFTLEDMLRALCD
ncbi:hypothetical protein Tco_0791873 [Tanacetum coccineum]